MFKLFIIILLSTINLCYAQELEQPQPLVLNDKSNDYQGDMVVFNEFTTGKKYCKRDTADWDDQCQDAVMYHIYGKNWRKFKNVALEFIKAARRGDSMAIKNLYYTTPPMCFEWITVRLDNSLDSKIDYARDEHQFLYTLEHKYLPIIQNKMRHLFVQYKNFKIPKYLGKPEDLLSHHIKLGKGIIINFKSPSPEFADYNDDHYIPKILILTVIKYPREN
ncbi:hypothetical protein Trichorick_00148 [Candidatus Trichorickettsia mobilis]|jgi:hypothetical protein|uniref:Uncharacterized protein n=1 Tax=Candidatus Trichorickettsia mobilis TaxID=1346319 RepID=A0ABZ0UR32_9RICK|nr:hypothetical protein [Candidatus Trichorickettsia mobilis]WPY00276.1 hypothetical protein Trichorick_00148 [Candidatus Trichorickettsia mobilis]